jgi:hypothetical protein
MVAKSFPQKQLSTKHIMENFCVKTFVWENESVLTYYSKIIFRVNISIILFKSFSWNFLWLLNYFLRNRFEQKIFIKHFLSKIFWLQNHFLRNGFEPKIFIKIFWLKIFYGCKIIFLGIVLNQKFSSKIKKFLV